MKNGQWLDIWKTATITPIPKVYPTPGIEILREISGLFHESKIAEKIVAEFMLSDIKKTWMNHSMQIDLVHQHNTI